MMAVHPPQGPLQFDDDIGLIFWPQSNSSLRCLKTGQTFQISGVLERQARRGVELTKVQLQLPSPSTKPEVAIMCIPLTTNPQTKFSGRKCISSRAF